MKTGILILTHDQLAPALLNTAKTILKQEQLDVDLLEAPADCDVDIVTADGIKKIQQLDQGQGVLILNDVYGATPFNIARSLESENTKVISGVNLCMLLRAINYQSLPLAELAEKAREGAVTGVRYTQ